MSAFIRRLIWNTRERLVSTDLNDATTLHHRALLEAATLLASGGSTRRHGVVSGLQVTVLGVGMDVSVGAGLALIAATSPSSDDSASQWVELGSAQTVTLAAADPTNPRWDVIEIAAADAVELSSLRDAFNPAIGTFTPAAMDKRRGSSPTLYATAGTAAAVPELPAGTAGRIPLAYVYVPAATATLSLNAEILCRPMLTRRDNLRDAPQVQVSGGGISADGSTATVVLHGARGTFDDGTPWEIDDGTVLTPNTAGATATYPNAGADTLYHAYAVKPRYPAGYAADLAAREFVPGSAARTAIGGGVASGIRGCFVIVQETGVSTIPAAGTAAGHPASTLNLSSTLSGLPNAFIPTTDAIYLGSYVHDQSAGLVFLQDTYGSEVRGRMGEDGTSGAYATWSASGSVNLWTDGAGTNTLLPPTAQLITLVMSGITSSGTANARIQSPGDPTMGVLFGAISGTFSLVMELQGQVRVDANGDADVTRTGTFSSGPEVFPVGYRDSCLACRAA